MLQINLLSHRLEIVMYNQLKKFSFVKRSMKMGQQLSFKNLLSKSQDYNAGFSHLIKSISCKGA